MSFRAVIKAMKTGNEWVVGERRRGSGKQLPGRRNSKCSKGPEQERQRAFPVVQWLRLCTPNARRPSLIPAQGTRSRVLQLRVHMPQLKILRATTKTHCKWGGRERGLSVRNEGSWQAIVNGQFWGRREGRDQVTEDLVGSGFYSKYKGNVAMSYSFPGKHDQKQNTQCP